MGAFSIVCLHMIFGSLKENFNGTAGRCTCVAKKAVPQALESRFLQATSARVCLCFPLHLIKQCLPHINIKLKLVFQRRL